MFRGLDYAIVAANNKLALNVKGVLESGKSAMEDGGALAPFAKEIDSVGGGAYHITYKGAVYIVLIALIAGGIGLVLSNGGNRQEKKDNMKWKVAGAVICFAAASILTIAELIGSGIFTTAGN